MTTLHLAGDALWERMERAVEKVRQRLERATSALEQAGVPYAVSGGNAVPAWVAQADEAAVRNTRDVDILLRRADLPKAIAALEQAGFVYRHSAGIDLFLDGPRPRRATRCTLCSLQKRCEMSTSCRLPTWTKLSRSNDSTC